VTLRKSGIDNTQRPFLTNELVYSFGGGSEMMAEGDKGGLWQLLEAGQQ